MNRNLANASNVGILLVILALLLSPTFVSSANSVAVSTLWGSFPVVTVTDSQEIKPSAAHDEGRMFYLVAYEVGGEISAVCLDHLGERQGAYALGSGHNPDVVFNIREDQYLVVWEHAYEIEGAYISGSCTNTAGNLIHIPGSISGDYTGYKQAPAVAYNHHISHGDYLVVWSSSTNLSSNWSVYGRRVTSVAPSIDGSFQVQKSATAFHYDPDVTYNLNMNEYLIVYVRDPSKGQDPNALDIYGRRGFNTGGMGMLPEEVIDSSAGSQLQPAVAAYRLNKNNPYLVVFQDYWNDTAGDVRGYLLNTAGAPQLLVNIATTPGISEGDPAIGINEAMGGYVVAWEHNGDLSPDLYARQVHNTGVAKPVRKITALPVDERHPALANGSATPFVTWQQMDTSGWDIYAQFLMLERVYLPLTVR